MRTLTYICLYMYILQLLYPYIHVCSNTRSLWRSEGCFLRTSVEVSNSFIHLYTLIRIYLYVSWTEWVGPLRYSLIRSYWLSQTGRSAQNRSLLLYRNWQLLPSSTETRLCDPVSLRIRWWVTYHTQPLCVWGILCFCNVCRIDVTRWCHRISHLWSFSFHSRYPGFEAWIGGPLRRFIICMLPVPYAYYTMIQWPVISLWSLIISHLYWFNLDGLPVP